MKKRDWLWLLAFSAVWLALRVFWLDSDPGIPAIWEYGFNVTDEGYYFGAAKDKYLWGTFCDFARRESFTYGYSPLTHWLALAAYHLFGLSDWSWRIPSVALYFLGWVMAFWYVTRRCGGRHAFIWCSLLSSAPVVVTYERMGCNDLVIGSLALTAFCLASGKGIWRIFMAAVVAGAISLVKPSVWVLLPVVASGVLMERKTRATWIDALLFAVASILSVCMWKGIALLSVLPETGIHGMTATEIIRQTTTHNALPSLRDIGQFLRGFSSFPRDICFKAFASEAALVSMMPLAMAARCILKRKWNGRLLLYLSVPAYAAAVSVNNSICLHYYHPALSFLPVLFAEAMRDLNENASVPGRFRAEQVFPLGMTALVAGVAVFVAAMSACAPRDIVPFASNVSNLPRDVVWNVNAGHVLFSAFAMTLVIARFRGIRALLREGWVWFLVAAIGASVAFSALPLLLLAPHLQQTTAEWLCPMSLSLFTSFFFLAIVFAMPPNRFRTALLQVFLPMSVALCFAFSPTWRKASVELLSSGRHRQRDIAKEIADLVPETTVVIGERSTQVLMGQPLRTATTMPGCDPIGILEALLARDPDTPLYALADSQNAYNLMHYREHEKEYALTPIKVFEMPSFANGSPAKVYLLRIQKR